MFGISVRSGVEICPWALAIHAEPKAPKIVSMVMKARAIKYIGFRLIQCLCCMIVAGGSLAHAPGRSRFDAALSI